MDADSNERAGATRDLYVVFDGPPSHESGRFVELEDAEQRGVGGVAEWTDRGDGYWTLGPFYAKADVASWIEREGGYFGMDEDSANAMAAEFRTRGAQVQS